MYKRRCWSSVNWEASPVNLTLTEVFQDKRLSWFPSNLGGAESFCGLGAGPVPAGVMVCR